MAANSKAPIGGVAATVLWVVSVGAFLMETPKRPARDAWVVTASEKISSRPALVRANIPFKTAARQAGCA